MPATYSAGAKSLGPGTPSAVTEIGSPDARLVLCLNPPGCGAVELRAAHVLFLLERRCPIAVRSDIVLVGTPATGTRFSGVHAMTGLPWVPKCTSRLQGDSATPVAHPHCCSEFLQIVRCVCHGALRVLSLKNLN
jgi:hypothetical protein